MKLYTKTIDGKSYTMPLNKIVVIKDNMQIFNPTEDILFSDGWVLYVPPTSDYTEDELIDLERTNKINDIIMYDSSDNVNIFYVNDFPIWLDKATRTGLMLRFNAEREINKTETTL